MNPFLKRQQRAASGIHGVISEQRTAKRIGARLQIASGALPGLKGDSTYLDFLIESKATLKDSMRVTLDWLSKISGEAENVGRTPALTVTFVTPDGKPRNDASKWVMIPEKIFKELLDGRVIHED